MFESIISIDTPKHGFRNIKEAKTWAKENITGIYRNTNTGEDIRVSRTAIDKYLGGLHGDRIHSTDGLQPNPDFLSNVDFLPSADIRQSVAEYRSPNTFCDKDTNFFHKHQIN